MGSIVGAGRHAPQGERKRLRSNLISFRWQLAELELCKVTVAVLRRLGRCNTVCTSPHQSLVGGMGGGGGEEGSDLHMSVRGEKRMWNITAE